MSIRIRYTSIVDGIDHWCRVWVLSIRCHNKLKDITLNVIADGNWEAKGYAILIFYKAIVVLYYFVRQIIMATLDIVFVFV